MKYSVYRAVLSLVAAMQVGCLVPQRTPTPAAELTVPELLAETKPPNVRYYAMLFGSQTTPRLPTRVHTWATMVKVTCEPGCEPTIEAHTISWFPDSGKIRPWKLDVEPGSNLTLDESIEWALATGQRVSMWGPHETWSGMYRRFVTQKEFLDADSIGYQCIDSIGEAGRRGNGCDCLHALSDMDPYLGRQRYPLWQFGQGSAFNMVRRLQRSPTLINPETTHDWLIPMLGLHRYPIVHRQYRGGSEEFSPEKVMELWLREQNSRRSKSRNNQSQSVECACMMDEGESLNR